MNTYFKINVIFTLSCIVFARELNQFNLIVSNATNQGIVGAATTNSSDGSFTSGFTNEVFDSLIDGNQSIGVGRVRSFRITVSNTTGPSVQESLGGSNTSSFITTGGQFFSDAQQSIQATSLNTGFPQQGIFNASTATVTSGETIGLSQAPGAGDREGSYAGNQFETFSSRFGVGISQSGGQGATTSRSFNATDNILLASQSQGITSQQVLGQNVATVASGEMFSASGSEETATNCALRGGFYGQQVVDGPLTQSYTACTSSGTFYDRNL